MAYRKRSGVLPGAFIRNGFSLAEFDRRPFDRYPLRAFVLDWSRQLTLVQVVDTNTFQLDGYAVFSNSDVRWWRTIPAEDFLARAVTFNEVFPSRPQPVDIASMAALAASVSASSRLIKINRERIKKNVCYVGRAVRANRQSVTIQSITPQAEWEGEESYRLKDITLLEFGGIYESLLGSLAK